MTWRSFIGISLAFAFSAPASADTRARFHLFAGSLHASEHLDPNAPVALPLVFEHEIAKDWSFIWFLVPIGLRYEINSDFDLHFHWLPGPTENFYISTTAGSNYRRPLSPRTHWESAIVHRSIFHTHPGGYHFANFFRSGLRYFLSDPLSVRAWIGLAQESGNLSVFNRENLQEGFLSFQKRAGTRYFTPIGTSFLYHQKTIGVEIQYVFAREHRARLTLTYYFESRK